MTHEQLEMLSKSIRTFAQNPLVGQQGWYLPPIPRENRSRLKDRLCSDASGFRKQKRADMSSSGLSDIAKLRQNQGSRSEQEMAVIGEKEVEASMVN
jgi:hypothetical protein